MNSKLVACMNGVYGSIFSFIDAFWISNSVEGENLVHPKNDFNFHHQCALCLDTKTTQVKVLKT